jgi:hypothetical protein
MKVFFPLSIFLGLFTVFSASNSASLQGQNANKRQRIVPKEYNGDILPSFQAQFGSLPRPSSHPAAPQVPQIQPSNLCNLPKQSKTNQRNKTYPSPMNTIQSKNTPTRQSASEANEVPQAPFSIKGRAKPIDFNIIQSIIMDLANNEDLQELVKISKIEDASDSYQYSDFAKYLKSAIRPKKNVGITSEHQPKFILLNRLMRSLFQKELELSEAESKSPFYEKKIFEGIFELIGFLTVENYFSKDPKTRGTIYNRYNGIARIIDLGLCRVGTQEVVKWKAYGPLMLIYIIWRLKIYSQDPKKVIDQDLVSQLPIENPTKKQKHSSAQEFPNLPVRTFDCDFHNAENTNLTKPSREITHYHHQSNLLKHQEIPQKNQGKILVYPKEIQVITISEDVPEYQQANNLVNQRGLLQSHPEKYLRNHQEIPRQKGAIMDPEENSETTFSNHKEIPEYHSEQFMDHQYTWQYHSERASLNSWETSEAEEVSNILSEPLDPKTPEPLTGWGEIPWITGELEDMCTDPYQFPNPEASENKENTLINYNEIDESEVSSISQNGTPEQIWLPEYFDLTTLNPDELPF